MSQSSPRAVPLRPQKAKGKYQIHSSVFQTIRIKQNKNEVNSTTDYLQIAQVESASRRRRN